MNKKELEAKKRTLLRELEKEKAKKKNAENKLSLYEYKEKQQENKNKPKIPETQKHQVVPVSYFEKEYDYDQRRKDWHKKAGHNSEQLVCSVCKDDDNWETILLEDGRHICYYCWIKKPTTLKSKKSKAVSSTKTKKTTSSSTKTSKVVNSSKKAKIVSLNVYNDYDSSKRLDQWNKYSTEIKDGADCSICDSKDNKEIILLENNKNVCYYCWIDEPKKDKKAKKAEENVIDKAEGTEEGPSKLFWIITIVTGLLLIGLLIVLSLGIISGFSFKF